MDVVGLLANNNLNVVRKSPINLDVFFFFNGSLVVLLVQIKLQPWGSAGSNPRTSTEPQID